MPTLSPSEAPNAEKKGTIAPSSEGKKVEESGKKNGEKQQEQGNKVSETQEGVKNQLAGVAPDVMKSGESARSMLEYKPLPRLPFRRAFNAVRGAAIIANPVVAASVYVPMKTWSGIKRVPPFSWIHRAGASVVNSVKATGKTVMESTVRPIVDTVTWPLRVTAVAGLNVGIGAAKVLRGPGSFTLDLFVHHEGESLNLMEKAIMFLGSLPNRTVKLVEALLPKIFSIFPELAKRPIRSMMLLALAAGGVTTMAALGSEILALFGASTSLLASLAKFFNAAAAWLL